MDLVRRVGVILRSKDRYRVLRVSKRGRGGFQRVLAGLQERTQGRAMESSKKAQQRAQE